MPTRDRTNQVNFDFTKYPNAKKIIEELPPKINKPAWVAEAIEEKHNKESNPFTEEQEALIDEKDKSLYKMITDWVHKYYIRKDDVK